MKMKRIKTQHKYLYQDGGIIDCFGEKMDSVDEYAEEMNHLMSEIRSYKKALHDAISRPMGVVPESAENLYDQNYCNKCKRDRVVTMMKKLKASRENYEQ